MLTLLDLLAEMEPEPITVKKPCIWIEDWHGFPFCYLSQSFRVEMMECLGFEKCQIGERILKIKYRDKPESLEWNMKGRKCESD